MPYADDLPSFLLRQIEKLLKITILTLILESKHLISLMKVVVSIMIFKSAYTRTDNAVNKLDIVDKIPECLIVYPQQNAYKEVCEILQTRSASTNQRGLILLID